MIKVDRNGKEVLSMVTYQRDELLGIMESDIFRFQVHAEFENGAVYFSDKNWRTISDDMMFKKLGEYLGLVVRDIVGVDKFIYIIF